MKSAQGITKRWLAVLAGFALVGLVPLAAADISDTIFWIEACRGGICEGQYVVPIEDGEWQSDGTFAWYLDAPVVLESASGEWLGELTTAGDGTYVVVDPAAGRSPSAYQVNLGFSVIAGTEDTQFTIKSALVSFDTIANGEARASAAFTVTDFVGTGATLSGDGPAGGAYLAQYNGFVPDGTTFVEDLTDDIVAISGSVGDSFTEPATGYTSIGEVSDMSAEIVFTLTANGLASGSSNYEIIPEPSALLLIVAGLAFARRR